MIGGDPMRLLDGLLLLTGLLGAVYGLIAKRVLAVDNPATVTTYAMLIGTALLLPAALVEDGPGDRAAGLAGCSAWSCSSACLAAPRPSSCGPGRCRG